MKKTVTILLLFCFKLTQAYTGDEIIGRWLTTDKDAIFEIYKAQGKYYGKLEWTNADGIDKYNSDPNLRKKTIIGRTTMNNFVFDGNQTWKNGTIYNGANGKTYSCRLRLESNNLLEVHGYVGIPLLGKSVFWTRLTK